MWRSLLSPIIVVITVLIIPVIGEALWYLPMVFALSVSLVNYKKLKTNSKFLGIFLSIIQTYAVFLGLAIVTYISDDFVQSFTLAEEEYFALSGIILVTLGGYLAALLLFYFSTFLYAIERRRTGYFILSLCYILVVLVMQIFSKAEFLQFGVEKFAAYLISWMIFMSLGFGITLNIEEIKSFIQSKK